MLRRVYVFAAIWKATRACEGRSLFAATRPSSTSDNGLQTAFGWADDDL
jgi:hypothetical protein